MVTVILQHEVKNFEEWKKVFDEDEKGRAEAGVQLMGLFTSVKNPNDVTMIFVAPGVETFNELMSDPQRQKDIERAGVIGAPAVSILNKV